MATDNISTVNRMCMRICLLCGNHFTAKSCLKDRLKYQPVSCIHAGRKKVVWATAFRMPQENRQFPHSFLPSAYTTDNLALGIGGRDDAVSAGRIDARKYIGGARQSRMGSARQGYMAIPKLAKLAPVLKQAWPISEYNVTLARRYTGSAPYVFSRINAASACCSVIAYMPGRGCL